MMNGSGESMSINPSLPTKVGVKMLPGRWVQLVESTFVHRDHIASVCPMGQQSPLAGGQMIKLPNKCVVFASGQGIAVEMSPEAMMKFLAENP